MHIFVVSSILLRIYDEVQDLELERSRFGSHGLKTNAWLSVTLTLTHGYLQWNSAV